MGAVRDRFGIDLVMYVRTYYVCAYVRMYMYTYVYTFLAIQLIGLISHLSDLRLDLR